MRWDIVLFNSIQNIKSIEDMEETMLEQTDFCSILEKHFKEIIKDDNHREIKGIDFTIHYFFDDEKVSNKMLSLYGEKGLYELIILAREHKWQIFDTGLDQMIDLENPSNNGYESFQNYLKQLLKK